MHTASVLGLGLLVLSAERVFAPERVYPWLGLASGLVALGLGAVLLVSRIHALSERRGTDTTIRIRIDRSRGEGWWRSRSPVGSSRRRARSSSCWAPCRSAGPPSGSS